MTYVTFSQELFDRICGLIADGKSVREICEMDGMPDRTTFNRWRKQAPELQKQYDAACLDREDVYFEDIIHIADTDTDPRRAKVRMDAREWTLARMNRKRFGDHVRQEVTGADGAPLFATSAADLLGKIRGES